MPVVVIVVKFEYFGWPIRNEPALIDMESEGLYVDTGGEGYAQIFSQATQCLGFDLVMAVVVFSTMLNEENIGSHQ